MNSYLGRSTAIVLLVCHLSVVRAQDAHGIMSTAEANRFGLERMWISQVEVDVARGRVTHLSQHVSGRELTTFFEVAHDGGKYVYGERDLDKFGHVIGKNEAQKLAQLKLTELQSHKINAKIITQTVPRITLYAVTDVGVVQAIDGETGRTLWKTPVGKAQFPTEASAASDDYVATVNGSDIYVLKAATGEVVWQRKASGAPGAGPAVTDLLVFVPMINGAMEAYPLDDPHKPAVIFRSHGRAMLQPIYTGTNVAWPTDRGHLYVSGGSQHRVSFRLEANAAIAAPCAIMPPNQLVASSIDGFVYCIHESSGAVQWRFSTGEPILTSPVPYGDTVYVATVDGTLFAIDGLLGQERWSTTHISQVIGASLNRLYCLNDIQQLEILDRKTGSRVGAVSIGFADLPYSNTETDRIIIGTTQGVLQCFREINQEYPLIHLPVTKSAVTTPKRPSTGAKPAAPGSSPFGESSAAGATPPPAQQPAADPFGGGAGGANKSGEKKPAEKKPAEKKPAEKKPGGKKPGGK